MPFRRRLLAPIVSNKHEMTWLNLAEDNSLVKEVEIAVATPRGDINTNIEVSIGSVIKSIYLEFHFSAEATTEVKVVNWTVIKEQGAQTLANPNALNSVDKSQIFKRGMEMLVRDQSTVFKRIVVISIPKGKQRMMEGSRWLFRYISSSANLQNSCGIGIYKEYT